MIRTAAALATALLFVLSGCASNAGSPATPQSPRVNPQAPNALDRLAPADETQLTLRFKNTTPDSALRMGAFVSKCIASVEPKEIDVRHDQTATVVITADTKKLCQDGDRFVFLDIYFRDQANRFFSGFLKVNADPPKYVWTARLNPDAGKLGLCTIPDGFEHGRQVHDDELIEFYLCK